MKEYDYGPLYFRWGNIKRRCFDKSNKIYKHYGGRGITLSEDWKSFKKFNEDMLPSFKKGLTLERIDNNGNYCKENCRWATYKEQQRNTRKNIIYNGEYMSDACERLGGGCGLIRMRLNYGWSMERAFTEPVNKKYIKLNK